MQNVKILKLNEFQIVTMILKMKNKTKERCILKKVEKRLQQQKHEYVQLKDFVRTFVEIDNRVKALEEQAVTFCSTILLCVFSRLYCNLIC